jgi:thiol:disulfide interchange protein
MKKLILFAWVLVGFIGILQGQIVKPVKWSFSSEKIDDNNYNLVFTALIDKPWHIYGTAIPEGGPIPLTVSFEDNTAVEFIGSLRQTTHPEIMDDPVFGMKVELHSIKAVFKQQVRKKNMTDSISVKGNVNYMTCNDSQCILNDNDFSFTLPGKTKKNQAIAVNAADYKPVTDNIKADSDTMSQVNIQGAFNSSQQSTEAEKSTVSLLGTFLVSLLAGLGGLLTPCVYPMIPMTVTYFMRGKKSKGRAIAEALVFGISIVFIYTLIGILVAIFKNPNAVNTFITHWATNLVFFMIFIALAASFFGMFELVLPGKLANKVDQQADRGGFPGAFFMALAMAILSFSCTGPIIASLLIAAAQGQVIEPVIGMLGFSIAFALPFTLFAVFPSWLQRLPKSGGWLNAVKVFFAFIMLAFALYFLSKIDQAYHLNILSREIYLVIWIVLFTLLGIYLLGKIKFVHDSDVLHIGVPRLFFIITVFSFALYLFTGLLGNDMRAISTLLPPKKALSRAANLAASDFASPGSIQTANQNPLGLCGIPEYADYLSLPQGLQGYFDYTEALACALQQNKPLLVDFVGHTCSNCKKMYEKVWSNPEVLEILGKDFIIVALYTDDKTKLPEKEWITSAFDGKLKTTLGKKNQDFQISRFNSNALPMYAIVDGNGKELTPIRYTYSLDIQKFIDWLKEGKKALGSGSSSNSGSSSGSSSSRIKGNQ